MSNARLLVIAHNGDISFDDPEKMKKMNELSAFAGGEIDPETGEMVYYKANGERIDQSQMDVPQAISEEERQRRLKAWDNQLPSMWGGLRQNPIFANTKLALQTQAQSPDLDDDYSVSSAGMSWSIVITSCC